MKIVGAILLLIVFGIPSLGAIEIPKSSVPLERLEEAKEKALAKKSGLAVFVIDAGG